MSKKPLPPEGALAWLKSRWRNQHRVWFDDAGRWPLTVSLAAPTERQFLAAPGLVRSWAQAWSQWREEGDVLWEVRSWPRAGQQRLPVELQLAGAGEVARLLGHGRRWERARRRRERWHRRWPQLLHASAGAVQDEDESLFGCASEESEGREPSDDAPLEPGSPAATPPGGLGRYFAELADYDEADFERLTNVLEWLLAHPASGLYIRELPFVGVDTKWLETRKALVLGLLARLKGQPLAADLYETCGLARPPATVCLKVLCPQLRQVTAGLRHLEAPLAEVARLPLRPRAVLIVENQTTGWALPDVAGAVAFVKLGNAVSLLAGIDWLREVPVVYWGDIDTYGLAILARARRALAGPVRSVAMDEVTLLAHRELWTREAAQHPPAQFAEWTDPERSLFEALRTNRWAEGVRLEQERLPWPLAWPMVEQSLRAASSSRG